MQQKTAQSNSVVKWFNSPGFEYFFIYLLGALGYGLLEILWRGYTHWTMLLTGGLCFMGIYWLNQKYPHHSIWFRCFWGMVLVTAAEFCVGVLVNRVLHWQVWDYSALPFNLLGQISLFYSGIWFLLGLPLSYFCRWLRHLFHRHDAAVIS